MQHKTPLFRIPSSRKSKIFKMQILRMFSDNLKVFFPELQDHFMCPTCLTPIPLENKKRITEAHIIPKAAQGKLKTYLCSKCNSRFGSKQDKWFGEYLKMINKDIPEVFSTDIRDGYFWIDGKKINGKWERGKNNELIFYIHKDKNPPSVIKLLEEKFRSKPPRINLKVSFPILKNKKMIEIGFLTAGYLMWFGCLGYSWVLQEHLDPIREQIMNPEKNILKTKFIAFCKGIRWKPWIGLVTIANEIFLTMGLENCLVLFPPADRPQIYSKLGDDLSRHIGTDIRPIQFSPEPFYGPSVNIMFNNRILVFPNAEHKMNMSTTILFTSDSVEGKILHSINKEEADSLTQRQNVVRIRPDFSPLVKKWNIKG